MFARVKEDSIITPLVFQTRSRNTPPKPGNSSCTVPLYLMAGTLSAGAPGGTARHIVTVCVSYWSEACQPKNHAIMGLTDTSEQVLARQAKLTVHVDVSRHLRVASVLSQPAFTPGEIAGGDIPSERGGLGDLFVTVQLVRHGTERALLVRLCGLFGPRHNTFCSARGECAIQGHSLSHASVESCTCHWDPVAVVQHSAEYNMAYSDSDASAGSPAVCGAGTATGHLPSSHMRPIMDNVSRQFVHVCVGSGC